MNLARLPPMNGHIFWIELLISTLPIYAFFAQEMEKEFCYYDGIFQHVLFMNI
jgi:hypothetical protein